MEKLIKQIGEYTSYDEEVIKAFLNCYGKDYFNYLEPEEIASKIDDQYQGEYNSDEDFAKQLLEETDAIPTNLPSYIYIDWEMTARDLLMDYLEDNGHYFTNI